MSGLEFELVLPCYNESKSLPDLIERVVGAAKEAGYSPQRFQLVLVENGSNDNSGTVMDELKQSRFGDWFRKVEVKVNQGYGFGIWSGLKTTTAKYVAWSHADMQCDPKDAFKAFEILKTRESVKLLVKGKRHGRDPKDRLVSWVFALFARVLLNMPIGEINAQPKVFPRMLLAEIVNPPYNFAFDLYVLYRALKAGYQIETIPVLFPPRIHGVSNWASTFAGRYKTILGIIRYMWEISRREGKV